MRVGPPTGATRVAAVIGSPVHHSLSPTLHNAAFAEADLDWVFVALDVAEGDGAAAVEAMRVLGLAGLSVTMPHKAEVAAAVDRVSVEAAALCSVNCVARVDDEIVGYSTDGPGFVDALVAAGHDVGGRTFAVLGAGGAARSIVDSLAREGAVDIAIVNRTPATAEAAAELAPTVARVADPGEVTELDVVVNATSVGMAGGGTEGAMPVPPDLLRSGQVVVDIVYEPVETPLLAAARSMGLVTVGGLGMLVHQAAHAFRHWTGLDAPVAAMTAAADAELARRA